CAERLLVERVFQNRFHALVAARSRFEGTIGGRFHPGRGVLFRESDDAQTRSITHLRMRLLCQDPRKELRGVRSDLLGPVHHARGRPLQMRLMALRPVLFLGAYLTSSATAEMRSYTLPFVKDLHGRWCRSHFHQLLDQRVGHAVEVGVEGDVVIDVHAGAGPLAHVEALDRQRSQSTSFDRRKHTGSRSFALPEWSLVQPFEQFTNRTVYFFQPEEL